MAEMNNNTATDLANWIPELWARKVYEEAIAKFHFQRFIGEEGSGMPIVLKKDLLTKPGDTINISQMSQLTGDGVTNNQTLKGNEEKINVNNVQTIPVWYRHGVSANEIAVTQIHPDFKMKASKLLSTWMAKKMDTTMWSSAQVLTAVGFEGSIINVVYGGDATSVDSIDSSDTFGVTEIRKSVATLEDNNIPKVFVPGMPAGEGYYICFINPFQAYSLKEDTEWINGHQNASERGRDNPIWTGALGEIDGAIIHSTTQCLRTDNAASPVVSTARAIMMGQDALCRGLNKLVSFSTNVEDYDFEQGVGVAAAWDDKVLSANAIVQIVTAARNPAATT